MIYYGNETYRCSKTDFHRDKNVVVTTGLTRFKGNVLRQDDDIEKSHVLLILKKSDKGVHGIIQGGEVTIHNKPKSLKY